MLQKSQYSCNCVNLQEYLAWNWIEKLVISAIKLACHMPGCQKQYHDERKHKTPVYGRHW